MEPTVTQADPEELLTVDEVAALLKMNPGSVRRLIQQDKLPAERFGHRTVRVRRKHVAAIRLHGDLNANDGTRGTGRSAEVLLQAAVQLRVAREVIANDPSDPYRYTFDYEDLAEKLEIIAARWGNRNIQGEAQLRAEATYERLQQIHRGAEGKAETDEPE